MSAQGLADLARVEKELTERGPGRMVPDLTRITALLDLLGNPQQAYRCIHVTGTNGKTSTARMIDALLRAFGLRVGRHTSPHLQSVTERIALDGAPLSPEAFAAAYDDVAPLGALVDAQGERVTYFELLTAMAFAAFADAPVDVAVLEVGLGGTWDATNVVAAEVAVIGPVSLDHTELLGPTLADIAGEKAGVIHVGATAVIAEQPESALPPLLARAAAVGAGVVREGLETDGPGQFGVVSRAVALGGQQLHLRGVGGDYPEVFLPLHGAHQAQNAARALAAVEVLLGTDRGRLDLETVRAGFADVDSPGRLERVRSAPLVLLDGAHNVAGAEALVAALSESFGLDRVVGVLAVLGDKDATGLLEVLEPEVSQLVVTQSSSPRALPVDELAEVAREVFGAERVEVADRLDDALDTAVRLVDEAPPGRSAGVLVTGSLVTVGEARELLLGPLPSLR